ncbi:MAG: hypothetical protein IJ703_04240 [Eubacterium sp.]|nr:hypothetical protein [Eubacterium sp.]
MIKRGITKKYKAAAISLALAMASLYGSGKFTDTVATVQDNVTIEMQNGLSDDGAFCKELKLNIPSSKTCVLTYGSDRYIIAISDDCSEVAIFAGSGGDASIFEILPMADSVYK